MAAKKKRPDAIDERVLQRDQQRLRAPKIAEKYPQIAAIGLDITYEDYDGDRSRAAQQMNFSLQAPAFFEFNCPLRECVLGGFNFGSIVGGAIEEKAPGKSGTVSCPGWQDRERLHKHRCYLKAYYVLRLQYRGGV